MILHACYGDNGNSRKLVSSKGIFWGVSSVFYPLPTVDYMEHIACHWGCRYIDINNSTLEVGGLQETDQFEVDEILLQ